MAGMGWDDVFSYGLTCLLKSNGVDKPLGEITEHSFHHRTFMVCL